MARNSVKQYEQHRAAVGLPSLTPRFQGVTFRDARKPAHTDLNALARAKREAAADLIAEAVELETCARVNARIQRLAEAGKI